MEVVNFGTYNIRNGRNGGLKSSFCGMSQANVDLGLLKETNIIYGVYVQGSAGFYVIASDTLIRYCRSGALFYKEFSRFEVESHQQHSLSVISFQLVTGGQRWYVVDF